MIPASAFKLTVIVATGLSLSGCVAAAIPLVAGGALARTGTDGRDAMLSVEASAPITGEAQSGEMQQPATLAASGGNSAAQTPELGLSANQVVPPAFGNSAALSRFVRYAGEQAFLATQSDEPAATAVLRNPGALDGERLRCEPSVRRPPAVLIDLDQGSEPFDPANVGLASPELSLSLKVLRSEGVEIAWISSNTAGEADIIRKALADAALDPAMEDQLLVLRYPGDRKQTRRKQLALETCLLAIAGDTRSDFDELYEYLTNPNAALELEKLIGDGWFLLSNRSSKLGPAPTSPESEQAQKELIQ